MSCSGAHQLAKCSTCVEKNSTNKARAPVATAAPADISDQADMQGILKVATCRKIESIWARIDTHLLTQGPYFLGAEFSAADLMLIMLMRWSRNMPRPATEWGALHQYAGRMKARPSWGKLYALEGLSEWT